jgi:hypothetical protein
LWLILANSNMPSGETLFGKCGCTISRERHGVLSPYSEFTVNFRLIEAACF